MTIYCFHCKRPVGSNAVPYEDLEKGHKVYYHEKCWTGAVKEDVVTEYVMLIMRVAGHKLIQGGKQDVRKPKG